MKTIAPLIGKIITASYPVSFDYSASSLQLEKHRDPTFECGHHKTPYTAPNEIVRQNVPHSQSQESLDILLQWETEEGIDFDFFLEEIIIRLDDEWLPIRMLSAGYRGLIGMVTDLAYRSSVLNPHLLERSISETYGIVLIDELDLHLHPRWQWHVIDALRSTFPRIQFIATTHAPILIASCIHGQIVNLGSSQELDKAPYGWRVEDVLREWMNSEIRDPEIERDINELRNLFSKRIQHELKQDEQERINNLIMTLNQILPESDPVITLTKLESMKRNP